MSASATDQLKHGIIILGAEPLKPETLAAAAACDEVFIVARAVAPEGRWLVDEDRAHREAEERLDQLRRHLRARGVTVRGVVGDANAAAARNDAEALYAGTVLR